MKTKLFLSITSLLTSISILKAQETATVEVKNPPVIVETVFGDKALGFQTNFQKKLTSAPKFGIFAVSDIIGTWDKDDTDGFMVQGNITYEFAQNLNLMGGFHMATGVDIRPAVGVIYSKGSPDYVIVFNPRYYIDDNGEMEAFLMGEYKPKISENWRFYSKIQAMYAAITNEGNPHTRSYLRLRAGVNYNEISFGLASNFEYFGSPKFNQNNFGLFVSTALF